MQNQGREKCENTKKEKSTKEKEKNAKLRKVKEKMINESDDGKGKMMWSNVKTIKKRKKRKTLK